MPENLTSDDKIMDEYQPGTCNIGSAEIAKRKETGWIGVGATAILALALVFFHVPAVWRVSLFAPAFVAATGFLQGFMHFCAGFGMQGVFNFGAQVGKTEEVEQAEFRRKDKQKAVQVLTYSALIAILLAAAAFFLPV